MGFVLAALGWTPRQFMNATNHEIYAGYEGWRAINCPKKES
jgi:hypothetical protein